MYFSEFHSATLSVIGESFMSFEKLLSPHSVAVVGASANPIKVGNSILANIIDGGFEGDIYPVNPKEDKILGLTCYKSVSDIPGQLDLVVLVIKREAVLKTLQQSAEKGVKAAIIITAGFGESDETGKRLQKEIIQLARQKRITVLGPNCLGLLNPWSKLNAAFGQQLGHPGGVAIVSQSGALITAMQDWARSIHLGFSVVASVGNKAAVDEVDFLKVLHKDPHTRVIAAYLEDISNGQDFMRTAEEVSRSKPVVILKSGRTSAGARAASSHTGSLAGADAAYESAFQRSGVIRAQSIEHLFDISTALSYQPVPKGNRIAVITNAGGPGIMMSDALEMAGLKVAALADTTAEKLSAVLPPAASWSNPVDVLGDAGRDRYKAAIELALQDEGVDGVIVILTPQKMTETKETAEAIVELSSTSEKPILACFMGADAVAEGVEVLQENNIPQYPIPDRAAKSMFEMVKYADYRSRPRRAVERFAVNKNPVTKIIKAYRSRGMHEIGEIDAKTIMSAYNFVLPPAMVATSVETAAQAGEQLGYPLAMKISSPDILHKSDVGGVRIGLEKRSAVEDAFELMMLRVKRKKPDAELRGVLIEKMVGGGKEVILGMKKDPQFGPMLMFGLGGIFVEVLKDVTFSLAPVTEEECMSMIRRTKSYKLLTGARGQRGVDIGAIVDNLMRMSQLSLDFPEIDEIDINPLKVGYEGDGAFVVDARIIISKGKA